VTRPGHARRSALVHRISGSWDPQVLYGALAHPSPDTILLESRDGNGRNDSQSFVLIRSALRIEGRGGEVRLIPLTAAGVEALRVQADALAGLADASSEGDALVLSFSRIDPAAGEEERLRSHSPLDVLRRMAFGWSTPVGVPPLTLPGLLGYDFIDLFEDLPPARQDLFSLPDLLFELPEILIHMDHRGGTVELIANGFGDASPDEKTIGELSRSILDLQEREPAGSEAADTSVPENVDVDLDDNAYCEVIRAMQQHILAGDVFQIVPSRTFRLPCRDPLAAYKHLRRLNPSPYLFYLDGAGFVLFGASPETSLRVEGNPPRVTIAPIAGTRPRGRSRDGRFDHDLDNRLEAELKLHGKELAEHVMLVDLARNDIARVSEPGSRIVSRLLEIERYSHVMHLVSRVEGRLRSELDALHALQGTMTMGTLTGAPKVEAARLLRRWETDRRGPYGGAIGYLTSEGAMDTAIVIRSALVAGGHAHVRAGAGIVFDSDPQAEADETRAKASAVLQAVARAAWEGA